MEKIERTIGRCSGQDHRHDREGRIAGLADQGEFAFVLLGVAEPRADQHDHRLGGTDRLFQRRNPGQARCKIAAIKERGQALGTQE